MNSPKIHLNYLIICVSLLVSSLSSMTFAQTDTSLDAQKAACGKNSAAEWSSSMNKCVGKVEDRKTRHEVEDCSLLTDIEQRKECHKKIAENKTGLNADPDSLPKGTTGKSAVMNGAASAYAILGIINSMGSGNNKSMCTSKKIFAVTAIAGTLSDIWLKIQAKKKLNSLKDKYQLDVKNNAYDAQSKAFQYLKDEQETVKDIAGQEKKRNMLLMLGYGAASLMAIYEMTPYGANSDCLKKEAKEEPKKDEPKADKPEATPAEAKPETTACPEGMTAEGSVCLGKVERGSIESRPLEPEPVKPATTTVSTTAATTEVTPPAAAEAPKKYVVTGSGENMRVREVDVNGKYTGNAVVTHGGSSYVINDSTGQKLGPVPTNADISWKDGRQQPIPSSLVKFGSATPANTINFSGKTEMKVDSTTYKLKRGGK